MRAVIYARISKEDQSEYSLDQQIKECKAFIERSGHEFVDMYVEDGVSAKDLNRPKMQELLSDLKERKFDLVVCWKLDRLTRDTVDGLTLIINLFKKKHNVTFVSVTEDIKTETSDDIMMLTIRLSFAQAEREKIRERVAMGQQARAKSGKRNSSAKPYGYNVGEDLALTINEDESVVVKQIFEWFIEGYGKNKICTILNKSGITPPRGGQYWLEPTIKTIITNPTFYGANHYKPKNAERIIVENTHESIVSKETWIHANEIMKRKKENLMNRSSYEFPFSTVLKCGLCERSYHGKMKTFKLAKIKYPNIQEKEYYRCSGKYRQNSCTASDIMEYKLVKLIFATIEFPIEPIDPNEPIDKPAPNIAKERKRILKELDKSKLAMMNLAKAMASGNIDFDIYTNLRNEEKLKFDNLERSLSELPSDDVTPSSKRLGEIAEEIKNLKQDWGSWSKMKQKQMIQKIFKRIVVNKINGEWRIEEIELNA